VQPRAIETGFLDYLRNVGAMDEAAHDRAMAALNSTNHAADTVLLELGLIGEEQLTEHAGSYLNMDVVANPIADEAAATVTSHGEFLVRNRLIVAEEDKESLTIVTAKPFDLNSVRALAYAVDKHPIVKCASRSKIEALFRDGATPDYPEGADQTSTALMGDDVERLRDAARDGPTVRLLNRLVIGAIDRRASDVHLEPAEDRLQVRYRIDGHLQVVETLPKQAEAGLVSRVKILSRLDIAEKRLPQDGRMRLPIRGQDVDFRVATAPVVHGENIVLRVLDRGHVPLDLQALGFRNRDREAIVGLMNSPHGLVLVTGPTGSGKSTTLYSMLAASDSKERKLFSIEDPVERRVDSVSQIQVQPQIGLDFGPVLRSVLRQDPDVIMVGEMRDRETIQTAVRAALTGHLVLSTLHTNSAASAITRLIDMGIDRYLISSCLKAILSQRLVRKLCTICQGKNSKSAQGCSICSRTGYIGRTVAYEFLHVNEGIRRAILDGESETAIENEAVRNGMTRFSDFAGMLVDSGVTSLDEIARVSAVP
jgi:general secretion pathway protein E